jgi:hypothetical protein
MPHSNSGLIRSWNNFLNAFRLAMDSIRAQKLRSFLTLLGVIIGVASVIMVGAPSGERLRRAEYRQGLRVGIFPGGADCRHGPPEQARIV